MENPAFLPKEENEIVQQEIAQEVSEAPAEKVGIDNIKAVLSFLLGLMPLFSKVKFTFFEKLTMLFNANIYKIFNFQKVLDNFRAIPAEITDLNEAERQELLEFFKDKFKLEIERTEKLIELSLDVISFLAMKAEEYLSIQKDSK